MKRHQQFSLREQERKIEIFFPSLTIDIKKGLRDKTITFSKARGGFGNTTTTAYFVHVEDCY